MGTATRWAYEIREGITRYTEQSGVENCRPESQVQNGPDLEQFPSIEGMGPDEDFDAEALWRQAIQAQEEAERRERLRRSQSIRFAEDLPICIANLSDIHLGNPGTDYRQARHDAEIVRDTEGMWAGFHGDLHDNWIIGKLQGLQRKQALPYTKELAISDAYLDLIGPKTIYFVSGNHDLWTTKVAGIDRIRAKLRGLRMLYHEHQIVFDLEVGPAKFRHLIRHKYRGASKLNPTHGIEDAWRFGDTDYDVAIGGHTHIGTLYRTFYQHERMRLAVLTGTYKNIHESFGEEIGFPRPKATGCGAIIYYPDGRIAPMYDLESAAEFITYLRRHYR